MTWWGSLVRIQSRLPFFYTRSLVGIATGKDKKMPTITLPDGSQRQFDHPVSVLDVAADIGPGLAKATLGGRVNDELVDASYLIEDDAALAIDDADCAQFLFRIGLFYYL